MATSKLLSYDLKKGYAILSMNDGGKNLMSPQMLDEINQALTQAEKDKAVVILTGHEDIFSAGFDLRVLKSGASKASYMLNSGFALTTRILSFPTPIINACNGHAVAMGVFILLSGDYRIGVEGPYKIVANEVALGMTMPATAIEVCKQRLAPAHFVRAVMQAEVYNPATAVEAGFLDKVVTSEQLMEEAITTAERFTSLDLDAHYRSKLRSRKKLIKALKRANRFDRFDIIRMGLQMMMKKRKK
ncbi:MAG: crotonase/enoyl-CoA hydratase family protein [Bacteroidota bacterium]